MFCLYFGCVLEYFKDVFVDILRNLFRKSLDVLSGRSEGLGAFRVEWYIILRFLYIPGANLGMWPSLTVD